MNKRNFFTIIGSMVLSINVFATSVSIDSLVDSRNYIFKAEAFLSEQKLNQLYEQYEMAVNENTTTAYLPYYGNGLTHKEDELAIIFSSDNFQYNITEVKNGWEIDIQPYDITREISVKLYINHDGEAILIIDDTKNGAVEYRGYIESYQE